MMRIGAAITAAILATLSNVAFAEYPDKPVRLVVPYPGGGSADLPARIYGEGLSRKLGQPFVIENRAGAAAAVGAEVVARAAPDGYTLYCGPNGPFVLLPQIRQLNYKPADFVPVAPYGQVVYGFAVLPSLGVKNMKELAALAKAKPGTLSYSSPGAGSSTNLRGEAFKQLAGVEITHIPYRTGAEAVPDFLAGRVSIMVDNIYFPQAREGKALILGMVGERRHPEFPDVPTLGEQGYPVDVNVWGGFLAPAGTPQPIIERLAKAINELNVEPDTVARMLKIGWVTYTATPAEMRANMDVEIAAYARWIKLTNFKID
jgi:tripartite-type tricarboxylate transporter receptor subunit TctC